MLEATKEIVIAMIENKYLPNYTDAEETLKYIKKAIDEVYKQIKESAK